MIEPDQVMPLLLAACPAFQDTWEAHRDRWYGQIGLAKANHYLDVGAFARFLVARAAEGRTACFPSVFGVVERLLVEGSDGTRTLAVTGLLEGIQNLALRSGQDYSLFLPWLGANAREHWAALTRFWGN